MSRIWNTASHAIGGGPYLYYVMFACRRDLAELWTRSSWGEWDLGECGWDQADCGRDLADYQCQRNSPKFDLSILWHCGIRGAADEAVLNEVRYPIKKKKKSTKNSLRLQYLLAIGGHSGTTVFACDWRPLWYYSICLRLAATLILFLNTICLLPAAVLLAWNKLWQPWLVCIVWYNANSPVFHRHVREQKPNYWTLFRFLGIILRVLEVFVYNVYIKNKFLTLLLKRGGWGVGGVKPVSRGVCK
jgi:hypothetical protein